MRGIFLKLSQFLRDCGGNVATIFSLALLPISVMGGGAVDFGMAMNARGRLAEALDAAALAVGSQETLNGSAAEQLALDFIEANYPVREVGEVQSISVFIDEDTGNVTVSGQSRVPTTLLGLIGMDYITVDWTSEAVRAQNHLELVMVLDNTGSMGGSKIRALRDAALTLTAMLHDNAQDPDALRIGLVPFAATVNVGRQFERVWWMDPDGESPDHMDWFTNVLDLGIISISLPRYSNHWDMFDDLRNTSWSGCVEARTVPLDIEDVAPNRRDPETLFFPFFAPDEPDIGNYANNYLNDRVTSGILQRLTNLDKYPNQRPRGGNPNRGCTTTPITPLTGDRGTVESAIRAMGANGTTNIPNGIAWGVRAISPQEPFTEGAAYSDENTIKAMIILTDGDNVLTGRNTAMMSDYSAYGYIADGRLGIRTASSGRIRRELDSRTAEACRYAREQGIRVYTITFQVRSASTRRLMEGCASHPSLYFDSPNNQALETAFELIAGDLTNLRLSR